MKRSLAAHDIVITKASAKKSKPEGNLNDTYYTESSNVASIDTIGSSQPNDKLMGLMPEIKETEATYDIRTFCSIGDSVTTFTKSDAEEFSSTLYFEKRSQDVTAFIKEAKTTRKFEESYPMEEFKHINSFSATKQENVSIAETSTTSDVFKQFNILKKESKIKKGKTAHDIKKGLTMTKPKSKLISTGTGIGTIKPHTSKIKKSEHEITYELRKTKASFDVRNISNIKKPKQASSIVCSTMARQTLPTNKISFQANKISAENMPKIREAKPIQRNKISKPSTTCCVEVKTRKTPNVYASTTKRRRTKFIDDMSKIKGVHTTNPAKIISKDDEYKKAADEVTLDQKITYDNEEIFSKKGSDKCNTVNNQSTLSKPKAALNIVDKVYLKLKEKEKASQTEDLNYTESKRANQTKLGLETYTQTSSVPATMPSGSSNRERVEDYVKNIKNTNYPNKARALIEKINDDIPSDEQDSAIYEQAASTINVTLEDSNIGSDVTQSAIHKDLAAGDQLSKNMENNRQTLKSKQSETEAFVPFTALKNYFISKTVLRQDVNQEIVTSTFTAKPMTFQDQASSKRHTNIVGSNETVWSVLKSYFSLPFSLQEDSLDETSEDGDDILLENIVEESNKNRQPARKINPLSIFKQFITFPSVNDSKVQESDDMKSCDTSPQKPTVNFFTLKDSPASANNPVELGNAASTVARDGTIQLIGEGMVDMALTRARDHHVEYHPKVVYNADIGDSSKRGGRPNIGDSTNVGDRPKTNNRPYVSGLPGEDEEQSRRRRRRRRGLPENDPVLEPRDIKKGHILLNPIDMPVKAGVDVGVQTEDDPEDPDRIVLCKCKEFIQTQKIKGTGKFRDKARRVDYVLVMRNQLDRFDLEVMKLTFLTGLVKAGFHLEAEEGVVHKDLLFIKLHASEATLHTYADAFGVRQYFVDSHEEMISRAWWHGLPFTKFFRYNEEREWIDSMRFWYKRPLRLSNYDRSFVVHKILQYKTFGENKNHFGIERLIKNNIILDAFALHNGPYQRSTHTGNFNGRQVLYTNWAGLINIFWMQPQHLIHEYFGSTVGYFFTFYEFYNKALLVAGLWGLFMMWVYYMQDAYSLFTSTLRTHICDKRVNVRNMTVAQTLKDKVKRNWFYLWSSLMCAECEGDGELSLCPYLLINDFCFDLQIMLFFENQYIILYSAGIAFLGILFLCYWRRVEAYWAFIRELGTLHLSGYNLTRPTYEPEEGALVVRCVRSTLRRAFFDVLLPILLILTPWVLLWEAFIVAYDQTRPLSLTEQHASEERHLNIVPPKVDKVMEYSVLFVTAAVLQGIFYVWEKLFHIVEYFVTTRVENHKTFESLDSSLAMCLFYTTINYTLPMVIYFAWLKGTFYFTPTSFWDVVFNLTLPFPPHTTLSYNMSELLPDGWSHMARRALTFNCAPFSCFRQAVVVYMAVLACRTVVIRFVECTLTRAIAFTNSLISAYKMRMKLTPTVEREYMLQRLSDTHFTFAFNSLVCQMALVFWFAPLFPLAPLLAFIVNMWDIRNRAHLLVVYHRRTIFPLVNGVGIWNQHMKIIIFAIPLFHSFTIARTQAFLIYLFHKVMSRLWFPQVWAYGQYIKRIPFDPTWWWKKFVLLSNFVPSKAMMEHPQFADVNKNRVTESILTGFLQSTLSMEDDRSQEAYAWPFNWDHIVDNITKFSAEPHHYEWMHYKAGYVLLFLLFFIVIAACMLRYVRELPPEVERRMLRERQLRRLRRARSRDHRPLPVRRRETRLLNEYVNE